MTNNRVYRDKEFTFQLSEVRSRASGFSRFLFVLTPATYSRPHVKKGESTET